MNSTIAFFLLAMCLGAQTGLSEIPPDLLPAWGKPIVAALLTIATFMAGHLKGITSAPDGMVQVPTKAMNSLSAAAEAAASQPPIVITSPTGLDDRKPAPPIVGLLLAVALLPALLGACSTAAPSSAETFSRSCTAVGEAMLQVNQLRRQGQVDDATFVRIDDLYDAAVQACDTLPVSETATEIAVEKVSALLAAAGGVTGGTYGY